MEHWHRHLNARLNGQGHPSLADFVKVIKADTIKNEALATQLAAGEPLRPQSYKYRRVTARMETCTARYNAGGYAGDPDTQMHTFLRGIVYSSAF